MPTLFLIYYDNTYINTQCPDVLSVLVPFADDHAYRILIIMGQPQLNDLADSRQLVDRLAEAVADVHP